MQTTSQYKELKKTVLDYVTFGGCFSYRAAKNITSISGLMIFDFDHIDPEHYKKTLSREPNVLMMFTSPGGDGLKVVYKNPMEADSYSEQYEAIRENFEQRYNFKGDKTSDIVRACFLSHDPNVWYRPEQTKFETIELDLVHEHFEHEIPWEYFQGKPLSAPHLTVEQFRENGWRHPGSSPIETKQ